MRAPILALLAVLLASNAHAFDIDRCGLAVPAGEVGHLVADLACPGSLEAGVYLEKGASLSLDGHSLLGDGDGKFGVVCVGGSCTVTGPGEVGFFESCITSGANGRKLTVSDVEAHHCDYGIVAPKIFATNVVAHHHEEWAFGAMTVMTGIGVTADDNSQWGFYGRRLTLVDSAMRRNGSHAVNAFGGFKGTNVTFEDNLGAGVVGGRIKASNLTATGNQQGGVSAHPTLSLRDSTLIDNAGYDLASERRPHLKDTVCGKSLKAPSVGHPVPFGTTWEVCTDD
jgi:hypothetical protein